MNSVKAVKIGLSVIIGMVYLSMLTGCSDSGSGANPFQRGTNSAFVVTSDFTTGSYSAIDLDTLTATNDIPANPAAVIHSDCNVKYFNGKIYLVNRLGADNITVLDVDALETVVNQFSVGNGANPYDIAFISDTKAYVALYASNELLVVDPTDTGDEIKARIDLSTYVDAQDTDGIVEANSLTIVGDYLFVSMQRMDMNTYAVPGTSVIAVINTDDNALVDVDDSTDGTQGIVLTGKNPQFMSYDPTLNKLLVSETGSYFAADGGIEIVDPYTFSAEGFVLEEGDDVGNAMGPFVVIGNKLYAAIAVGYGNPVVMEFQYNAGANSFGKIKDIFTATAYLPSLSADGFNRLIIPDRNLTNPGVRFYDTAAETLGDPVYVGLPPKEVVTF